MQHSGPAGGQGSRMAAAVQSIAAGLDAQQPYRCIADKVVKSADSVAAAAHASHHIIGQAALGGQDLRPGFPADDRLKVPHQHRVGMRPHGAANQVMGSFDISNPIPDGFVDGVFQGAGAGGHRHHFGGQQTHPKDIGGLTADVLGPHIDQALQAQHRANGGGGDPVLPGAGFGDNARLAHIFRQQRLPQGIVDFMGAGMGQILPFQVDFRPAAAAGQVFGKV